MAKILLFCLIIFAMHVTGSVHSLETKGTTFCQMSVTQATDETGRLSINVAFHRCSLSQACNFVGRNIRSNQASMYANERDIPHNNTLVQRWKKMQRNFIQSAFMPNSVYQTYQTVCPVTYMAGQEARHTHIVMSPLGVQYIFPSFKDTFTGIALRRSGGLFLFLRGVSGPPKAQLIHTLSKFHCLIHELYPTIHQSSQEHAICGTSCLLAFLVNTTYLISNLRSI